MANRLKMAEHNAILGLARLGWSFRRIAAELGVDRETVARHVKAARGDPAGSNAAISITGSDAAASGTSDPLGVSDPPGILAGAGPAGPNAAIVISGSAGQRSRCEPFRAVILTRLELGLLEPLPVLQSRPSRPHPATVRPLLQRPPTAPGTRQPDAARGRSRAAGFAGSRARAAARPGSLPAITGRAAAALLPHGVKPRRASRRRAPACELRTATVRLAGAGHRARPW